MRIVFFFPLLCLLIFALIYFVKLLEVNSIKIAELRKYEIKVEELPEFSLPDLYDEYNEISADDIKKNKYSVLNVFSSWCKYCKIEHPEIMKLAKRGVVPIYGINWKDETEDAVEWLDEAGNPYVVTISDVDGKVSQSLGVKAAPETLLVNDDGKIIFRYCSYLFKIMDI